MLLHIRAGDHEHFPWAYGDGHLDELREVLPEWAKETNDG